MAELDGAGVHVRRALEALLLAVQAEPDDLARLDLLHRVGESLQGELEKTALRARAAGATWPQVGAALQVSKQAAQQRYGT